MRQVTRTHTNIFDIYDFGLTISFAVEVIWVKEVVKFANKSLFVASE